MDGKYAKTHLSMSDEARRLVGAPACDMFRTLRKTALPRHMFGLDIDFVVIEKNPFSIVAFYDHKLKGDRLTFSEVVAYNQLLETAPVYIIFAESTDAVMNWEYSIYQYMGGDPVPEPPKKEVSFVAEIKGADAFAEWEQALRDAANGKNFA